MRLIGDFVSSFSFVKLYASPFSVWGEIRGRRVFMYLRVEIFYIYWGFLRKILDEVFKTLAQVNQEDNTRHHGRDHTNLQTNTNDFNRKPPFNETVGEWIFLPRRIKA
jgi:hypothetical protein